MSVVPAEIQYRATLRQQLIEWQSFGGEFGVDRLRRLARVVFSADRTLRDRFQVFGDEFCGLGRDLLKCVVSEVERGLRSQWHCNHKLPQITRINPDLLSV